MDGNQGGWSHNEYDRGGAAGRRVGPPAIGLMTVAMLGLASNCLWSLALHQYNRGRPKAPPPANMTPAERQAFQRGQASAPLFDLCAVGIPTIAICGLVAFGGAAMQSYRSRGLAVTAAVLAMLPWSPAFVVGLPVGIWALVVLRDPEVVELFARGSRPPDVWSGPG